MGVVYDSFMKLLKFFNSSSAGKETTKTITKTGKFIVSQSKVVDKAAKDIKNQIKKL